MANHEGRPKYGGSFATARAGADYPCAAQKSGISRTNSDALVRGVRFERVCPRPGARKRPLLGVSVTPGVTLACLAGPLGVSTAAGTSVS